MAPESLLLVPWLSRASSHRKGYPVVTPSGQSRWLGRLCCLCAGLTERRKDGRTACNQKTELAPLTRTWCVLSLLPGTLKATEFQNCCMQTTLEQNDVRGKEDCLYLNIWIPQGKKEGMCLAETWGGDSQPLFVVHTYLLSWEYFACGEGEVTMKEGAFAPAPGGL